MRTSGVEDYTDTTAFARHERRRFHKRSTEVPYGNVYSRACASADQAAANAAADARNQGDQHLSSPGARAIGQLPPPWQAWLAKAFGLTCEVDRSPLTFMLDTAVLSQPPSFLGDTVESVKHPDWRCSFESWVDSDADDRSRPEIWPGSALLTCYGRRFRRGGGTYGAARVPVPHGL